jgi:hypothetical protein
MPRRSHFWPIVAICLSCSLFDKPSLYQQGLNKYCKNDFSEASRLFSLHYARSPQGDSTLYYLYDCYRRLGQTRKGMEILEILAGRNCPDSNVYFNLFSYYQQEHEYQKQYGVVLNASPPVRQQFDRRHKLTMRLFAELLTGAVSSVPTRDPVGYVISRGFLNVFPDGQFYGFDTVTIARLIVMLDRLVAPVYPQKFYVVKNIPARSFLYLPYMRLVENGILALDPEMIPEKHAPVSMAICAISNLKERGILR